MGYKALLVGVNYYMQKGDHLLSPLNNIEITRDFLVSYCHFKKENITLLSDSPDHNNADFFSITAEIKKLIKSSNKNDFLFIYFSGYGNYLGLLDKNSDKYLKENMKMVSLYKKKDPETVFLPQDFHNSTLTKQYFNTVLTKSNSRIFLMFDCFNKTTQLDLKYGYDIHSQTFNTKLSDKLNNWDNDLIILSANSSEKINFLKLFKVNFINDKLNKFYSHFTIYYLKYLMDYLQLNINFNTFTYESMYKSLLGIVNDKQLQSAQSASESQEAHCCGYKKFEIYLSFSKKTLVKHNFLDTSLNENDEKKKENEKLQEKLKYRDKSIAYKNIGLERKIKILEQRNDHLIKQYKLQTNTIFN